MPATPHVDCGEWPLSLQITHTGKLDSKTISVQSCFRQRKATNFRLAKQHIAGRQRSVGRLQWMRRNRDAETQQVREKCMDGESRTVDRGLLCLGMMLFGNTSL